MLDVMTSLQVSYSYIACSTSSEVVSLIKGTLLPAFKQTIVWHGFTWLNNDDDGQLGGNKMLDSIWILDCWTAIIHCTERQFVIFSTVESFAIMR